MVTASELDLYVTGGALISRRALWYVILEGCFLTGSEQCGPKVGAIALAECVNVTEITDLKQKIRDFSYGTSSGYKIKYLFEQYVK